MKNQQFQKLFLIGIVIFGISSAVLSLVGFAEINDRILFLDKQLWSNHKEVMESAIDTNYPYSLFIKDIIINTGLFCNSVAILLSVLVISIICFVVFKIRNQKQFYKGQDKISN
jgi:hypothetical protein